MEGSGGKREKKKENSRLVAKEPSESDRYESCIVERSTTKSRHVRHGAWKMLGKGKGGIPTSSRSISCHGPHRRSPSFSSAVVSSRKDTRRIREGERRARCWSALSCALALNIKTLYMSANVPCSTDDIDLHNKRTLRRKREKKRESERTPQKDPANPAC